ncbi:MAG: PHP domain-containing protein [Candidatus Firestonebacteria bacterium]
MDIQDLESKLDNFDKKVRLQTLGLLKKKVNENEIAKAKKTRFTNLHCHTFHSFNAYGYSPSHVAWRAFKEGLEVIGIVDFDVLDGVDEILEAGKILGIKTVAGIETRVFVKEYSDKVINSPQEKGVYYFIGSGFHREPELKSNESKVLQKIKIMARDRNLYRLKKINALLHDVKIDYDKDILPLTPAGNVTERHIFVALANKAEKIYGKKTNKLIDFWATKLHMENGKISSVISNPPEFLELIRSKLIKEITTRNTETKRDNFPSLEEVIKMVESVGALPAAAWLDGINDGEKNIKALTELLLKKGIRVLNIIPDRNWNIKNKEEKKIKVKNLDEVIKVAGELNLPVMAGTEMNKFGQRFVDDFTSPELSSYLEVFCNGAFFVYGHTQMAKSFEKGYNSQWAEKYLPSYSKRNDFYIKVGKRMQPDKNYNIKEDALPSKILDILKEE